MKPSMYLTLTLMVAAGCATTGSRGPSDAEIAKKTEAVMLASFKGKGVVSIERLQRDPTQVTCSEYAAKPLPKALAERIEKQEMSSVKLPADRAYMGDWRRGEEIAQSGRGLQFTDTASTPRGGNCYACHQLSPNELSFGTIGPSLLNFGKLRGRSDAVQQYAFGKIYDSQAYQACSNMPRFGAMGILTEQQIKDVVALLLDPESPVNK